MRALVPASLAFALVLGAAACGAPIRIAPAIPMPKPDCVAPSTVDGAAVTPVALGDTISGDARSGEIYSFCAKPSTWVDFTFAARATIAQPALLVNRGSIGVAENRFFDLDADHGTQLLVSASDDAPVVFTLGFNALNDQGGSNFEVTLARPGEGIVVAHGDAPVAVGFDEEVWGAFTSDADVHQIDLPPTDHAGVLTVRAAIGGYFGNGATAVPVVDVVDDTGAVIAEADFTTDTELAVPVLQDQKLSLRVRASDGIGERPFYALEQITVIAPAPLQASASADAQGLELLPAAPGVSAATLFVELAPGAAPTFSFPVRQGETASFTCRAASVGSGARDVVVDLTGPDGTVLSRASEHQVDHVYPGGTRSQLDPATASQSFANAGNYVGSVKAGSFAEGIAGHFAICTAASSAN